MNLCSICSEQFSEYPCSAHPINPGQCCPRCDDLIVTPIRMLQPAGVSGPDAATVTAMFQRGIEMRAAKQHAIQQMMKKAKTNETKKRPRRKPTRPQERKQHGKSKDRILADDKSFRREE